MTADPPTLDGLADRLRDWGASHAPNLIRVVVILVGAWLVSRLIERIIHRVELSVEDDDPTTLSESEKRARTLGRIGRQVARVAVWTTTAMLVLGELGVNLGPIIAGAGILGLAVGFGAQTLVKDVITGFFILLENQYRVNDVIAAAGVEGLVEAINLRTTVLRDPQGRVHVIPNGSINVVTNFTRDWSKAVLDIGVAYKEDVDRCYAVLRQVGAEMEKDPAFGPKILEPFEYPGVERLDESSVVLRISVKTHPQERWNVSRELRRRVKIAFDREGIEIPFPQRTLHMIEGPGKR